MKFSTYSYWILFGFCLLFLIISFPVLSAPAFNYQYRVCSGSELTIAFQDQSTTAGVNGWLWELSDGQRSALQNPVFTVTNGQMLEVKLTITSGDSTRETLGRTIELRPVEEILIPSHLLLCPGASINLNPDGDPGYQYNWSPARGLSDANMAHPLASPPESTTYTVTITDHSGNGSCERISSVEIFVPPPITLKTDQQVFACTPTTTLEVETDPSMTINWFDQNAVLVGTGLSTIVKPLGREVYYVEVMDPNGCKKVDSVEVNLLSPIELTADGDTSLCELQQVTLSAKTNLPEKLEWSDDPNFANILGRDTTLIINSEFTALYFARVKDGNGCSVTDSVMVENNAIALHFEGNQQLCAGEPTQLIPIVNLAPDQILEFEWMDSEVITAGGGTDSPVVQPQASAILNFNAINQFGCELNGEVNLTVINLDTVVATADPPAILAGGHTQLNTTGNPLFVYKWMPAESLDNPNIPNPVATPSVTTTYIVTVQSNGCSTARTITVVVNPVSCSEPEIFLPNAFTPNGDGVNDLLLLRGNSIIEVHFVIYNRRGERVFESNSIDQGWDGTFAGRNVDPDVFSYYLEASCLNGEQYIKQGNVTVLK